MNIEFSSEDVREHLNSLGYQNLSDSQLKEFVHDLRRLIKYEDKQKKLQRLINEKSSKIDENEGKDVVDKSAQFQRVQQTRKDATVRKVLTKQRQTLHYNKNTGDINLTNDSVSLSVEESSSSTENSYDKVNIRIKTGGIHPGPPENLGELKQILPPRPVLPTKPTCSFIRPVIKEPKVKSLKHDPVKLHQFYKEQWEKQRLPGEFNQTEKNIRWATREWMNRGKEN